MTRLHPSLSRRLVLYACHIILEHRGSQIIAGDVTRLRAGSRLGKSILTSRLGPASRSQYSSYTSLGSTLMATDAPLSFNQAVRGITEFIEVAIHTILYARQVYPSDVFVRRKKYNTPVYQSRHPGLNEYISGATKAISEELALGNVDKVIVVIKNKEEIALERFIFAIQNMIQVESFNKETSVENAMTASTLGHYFRSFIVKLSMIESQLGEYPLPDDLSFAIVLELKDDKAPTVPQGKDLPPWVPASTQHTTAGASDEAELHMLRAVDTGIISLSLAVQESAQKLEKEKHKSAKGKEKAA